MSEEHPEYLAYLLRMWRVQEDGGSHWRASLERPADGERCGFASLEATFDFLRARTKERLEGPSVSAEEDGCGREGR